MLVSRACGGRIRQGGMVIICLDNQTSIRAIRAHRITSGMVLESRDELEQLCKSHQVTFWSGRQGGADKLVHRGTVMNLVKPELAVSLPLQFLRKW